MTSRVRSRTFDPRESSVVTQDSTVTSQSDAKESTVASDDVILVNRLRNTRPECYDELLHVHLSHVLDIGRCASVDEFLAATPGKAQSGGASGSAAVGAGFAAAARFRKRLKSGDHWHSVSSHSFE